jgi:hypothetical protein
MAYCEQDTMCVPHLLHTPKKLYQIKLRMNTFGSFFGPVSDKNTYLAYPIGAQVPQLKTVLHYNMVGFQHLPVFSRTHLTGVTFQLLAANHPHLHAVIGRTPSAFWHHPVDILTRILYVARFAVDAVLGVDLQPLA